MPHDLSLSHSSLGGQAIRLCFKWIEPLKVFQEPTDDLRVCGRGVQSLFELAFRRLG